MISERHIAEHLMLDSGRPVLVVPRAYADFPAYGSAAIAWDDLAAAARALGDAVALLSVEVAKWRCGDPLHWGHGEGRILGVRMVSGKLGQARALPVEKRS